MQAEVLKKIERDEDIAEEFQDGNKSDRGAESLWAAASLEYGSTMSFFLAIQNIPGSRKLIQNR